MMSIDIKIKDEIEKIKQDNTSGAAEITRKAACIILEISESRGLKSRDEFFNYILIIGKELISSQPSMPSLINLFNSVLIKIERIKKDKGEIKKEISSYIKNYIKEDKTNKKNISYILNTILKNRDIIFLHSFSSTILNALIKAKKTKKIFRVICTESRPLYEGRKMALSLARTGIDTELIVDTAGTTFISKANKVIVGADCICMDGIVNKIGTSGYAMAAKYYDIPFYVVSGTDKFLSDKIGNCPSIVEKRSDEVFEKQVLNLKIKNYYFDITPYKLISGIITEKGMMNVGEIKNRLKNLFIHKDILKMFDK